MSSLKLDHDQMTTSTDLIITSTDMLDGYRIRQYLGMITGDAVIATHVFRDIFAGLRDFFGGRVKSYEDALGEARAQAQLELEEKARQMGADAVIGLDYEYQALGSGGSLLMVAISGTAVKLGRV